MVVAHQPLCDILVARCTHSVSPDPKFALPGELWCRLFNVPSSGDYGPVPFTEDVCRTAMQGSGSVAAFQVWGEDVDRLTDHLEEFVDEAGSHFNRCRDFTEVMTLDHNFSL